MMEKKILDVIEGGRLDVALAALLDVSRAVASRVIAEGGVTVSGVVVTKAGYKLAVGDRVEAEVPEAVPCEAVAQDIPLDIVYEDSEMLVINKPKGLVVHPAAGNLDGTLVNALLHHCGDSLSGINGVMRPGIVHRIDKDTSGLLLVAKTDSAHRSLAEQISSHSLSRVYVALVHGKVKELEGVINEPIARHPTRRKEMAVALGGRNAVTHYKVLAYFDGFTLLECRLETGRTHQIRVHMAHRHNPVVGDTVYAKKTFNVGGQMLHAAKVGFVHPKSEQYMEFYSDLPPIFKTQFAKLRGFEVVSDDIGLYVKL